MFIPYRKLKRYVIFIAVIIVIGVFINNSTSILKMLYPVKHNELVYKYSKHNGLDPHLVFAIIKAESNFKADSISYKNARGLMQLTDSTAYEGAQKLKLADFTPEKLYDPEMNIKIGTWYLNWLMEQLNGNIDLVIAAYNGGIGNVKDWLKDSNLSGDGQELDKIPFKETENFLKKVKSYQNIYKRVYR